MTRQLSLLHSCATEARNLAKRFSLCIVKQRLQLLATNICRKKTLFRRKPYLIFVILSTLRRKLRPPPQKKWWRHLWTAPKPYMICEFFVQCTFPEKQLRASFQVCCARLSASLQVLVAARGFATFVTFILSQEGRGGQRGFNATLRSFFLFLSTHDYVLAATIPMAVAKIMCWAGRRVKIRGLTGLGNDLKNKPERETKLNTGFCNHPIGS